MNPNSKLYLFVFLFIMSIFSRANHRHENRRLLHLSVNQTGKCINVLVHSENGALVQKANKL